MPRTLDVNFTVKALFLRWLEFKSMTICDRTLEWYKPISNLLVEFFPRKSASKITKADAFDFLKFLLDTKKFSSASVRRKIQALSACWRWAFEFEVLAITKNPWLGLYKLVKTDSKKQARPFTQKEVASILKAFEESERYSQLLPFVKFLFLSGARTGEVIGLRWTDLSRDLKTLTVQSQLTRKCRKAPKNDRIRSFQLSDELVQILIELKKKSTLSNLVFLYRGEPLSDNTFYQIWRKVLKQARIPYRKPYTTRHTFISHSLQSGLSPVDVSVLCGNSPRMIYDHYAGAIMPAKLPSLDFTN